MWSGSPYIDFYNPEDNVKQRWLKFERIYLELLPSNILFENHASFQKKIVKTKNVQQILSAKNLRHLSPTIHHINDASHFKMSVSNTIESGIYVYFHKTLCCLLLE